MKLGGQQKKSTLVSMKETLAMSKKRQGMHLSDDDGGIDERFDGDDDSVNNNDSDDIQDD